MGAGASAEDKQAIKFSVYSAAAKLQGEEVMEEEEEEDFEGCFPAARFGRFMRGKLPKEEIEQAISSWVQQQVEESEESLEDQTRGIWREALLCIQRCCPKPSYLNALNFAYEVLSKPDPERIFILGLQAANNPDFAYALLESLPEVQEFQNDELLDLLMDFYPLSPEQYDEAWKLDIWQKAVLPRAKDVIVKRLQEKDDEGRCRVLFEHLDNNFMHSLGEWLSLGADPTGIFSPAEVEELNQLHRQVNEYGKAWPYHLKLVKAIGTGDTSSLGGLMEQANINEHMVDSDSKAVSLLVLSMMKSWDRQWTRVLLEKQGVPPPSVGCVWLPYDSLDIFKTLLTHPDIDPNLGAYSYGWHGSHVRATPLGMALLDELDTGCCNHSLEGDRCLVVPRREIVKVLANDARVDLEDVFFEAYEEGGDVWLSALTHLECKSYGVIDLATAMVLMQAGALMSPGWVKILQDLNEGLRPDMTSELEEQRIQEQEEAGNDRPVVKKKVDGYTLVEPHEGLSQRMKKSEILKRRIEEEKEVKEWYGIVQRGGNVFEFPRSFPPNFCRVAHALDTAFRKRLGGGVVRYILDFLPFYEFNRRRVPRSCSKFHNITDGTFGRPLVQCVYDVSQFQQKMRRKLEAEAEEEEEADADAGKADDVSSNDTCWVQDSSLKMSEPSADDDCED